jgi:hypothetical protein
MWRGGWCGDNGEFRWIAQRLQWDWEHNAFVGQTRLTHTTRNRNHAGKSLQSNCLNMHLKEATDYQLK